MVLLSFTCLVYWPGLSGDFIYDDTTNFETLTRWTEGLSSWQAVVLDHNAGPLGRPVAMATFLFNAATSGMDPFWFKLTNLLLHLLIGLIVYLVVVRLNHRDRQIIAHLEASALVITAVWLLHPMMVGTVLYAVQRMAILSALFMLLAMLAYLIGRTRIEAGRSRAGVFWIAIGVPVFTLLAAFSKENGVLAPLLCVVLEWVYFRPKDGARRPRAVRALLWIGVALPSLAALILLISRPELFLAGFENRPFTMYERLLTQGRVLFDYLGNLLLPMGPSMSLFRDEYPISTGLFSPWTTALAALGWGSIIVLAVRLRRSIPAFSAGAGIFLVGHAMESSILPLMMYFEHRNYLPALGVFLAMAGLVCWGAEKIQHSLTNPKLLYRTSIAALLIALSTATLGRAMLWSNNEAILEQSLTHFPDSPAARLELAQLDMNRFPPDLEAAQAHYRHLLSLKRSSVRIIGAAGLLASSCYSGNAPDRDALVVMRSDNPDTLETDLLGALKALADMIINTDCDSIHAEELAQRIDQFVDGSILDPSSPFIWQLRYQAAQLFKHAGDLENAIGQAQMAWRGNRDQLAAGFLLMEFTLIQGDLERTQWLLEEIADLVPKTDSQSNIALDQFRIRLTQTEP